MCPTWSCYDFCSPEGSRTTVETPAAKPDSKATALPVKEPEVARQGQMQKDEGKDDVFGFRKFPGILIHLFHFIPILKCNAIELNSR